MPEDVRRKRQPRPSRNTRLREALEAWFPIVCRYTGLAVIFYSVAIDRLAHPEIFTGGVGLALIERLWKKNGA